MLTEYGQPVGKVVKDIAIVAEDLGFDSRAGQIGHCRHWLTVAAMLLRHYHAELSPVTRYELLRNTVSVMKMELNTKTLHYTFRLGKGCK